MTAGEDKRALERFVAGLEVEEHALAAAVTARAMDRTIVVEALLAALSSPQASERRRAAERVARMADVAPRIVAELTLIAGADSDERAREAGAAALRAHGLPVPGTAAGPERTTSRTASAMESVGDRLRASLWLQSLSMRSKDAVVLLVSRDPTEAPDMRGRLIVDDDGNVMIVLSRLPASFAGSRPTMLVRRDAASAFTEIGTADEPVSADGAATIRIAPEIGTLEDVEGWLEREVELVAAGP